jgi:hypothetical protein
MPFPKITKDTVWIVVGIDGTGSAEWTKPKGLGAENSHVARFVRECNVNAHFGAYYHGPGTLGIDTTTIHDAALSWIGEKLEILVPGWNNAINKSTFGTNSIVGNMSFIADIRVCLVGHSRGGAIVQKLASNLPFRVFFLGLFDSVDRSANLLTGDIENVEYAYHAKRDPKMDSRDTFGNTGEKSKDGYYQEQVFMTSHGGVGGDFVSDLKDKSLGATSDYSCTPRATVKFGIPTPKEQLSLNYSSSFYLPTAGDGIPSVAYTKASDIAQICETGSKSAWDFIRKGAVARGVPMK